MREGKEEKKNFKRLKLKMENERLRQRGKRSKTK